jgi:hypothetical protein
MVNENWTISPRTPSRLPSRAASPSVSVASSTNLKVHPIPVDGRVGGRDGLAPRHAHSGDRAGPHWPVARAPSPARLLLKRDCAGSRNSPNATDTRARRAEAHCRRVASQQDQQHQPTTNNTIDSGQRQIRVRPRRATSTTTSKFCTHTTSNTSCKKQPTEAVAAWPSRGVAVRAAQLLPTSARQASH